MMQKSREREYTSGKAWQPLEDSSQNIAFPVEEAWEHVKSHLYVPSIETCKLELATARVLAEDIYADRDFPPFDRVAMDGICLRFDDFVAGNKSFQLKGIQAAGSPQMTLPVGLNAIEVMTGASLPLNSDTVIRYEDIDIINGEVSVSISDVQRGQNVHHRGNDRKSGDLILHKPRTLTFADIGVLATVGKNEVNVFSHPKIAIVSTGDELVDVDQTPLPHQIRKSNVYCLTALLDPLKLRADMLHISDDRNSIITEMTEVLNEYDTVLFSGAVSKGKYDFLPEVLSKLNVEKHFHQVQQRPGKPFWFGSRKDVIVFAFPGNPVSTSVCAIRYFMPWLRESFGLDQVYEEATLSSEVVFKPNLQYFLPVRLTWDEANLIAIPQPGHGSGDLANLADADGFIELPADQSVHRKGGFHRVWRWS